MCKTNRTCYIRWNVITWHTGVRHLGNFFNSCPDINVDTNCKCYHFIGYYNHMMSNFSHLNPESVVTLFKSYFYGNTTVIVLENAVHNGANVFEEYILFHITHIEGY